MKPTKRYLQKSVVHATRIDIKSSCSVIGMPGIRIINGCCAIVYENRVSHPYITSYLDIFWEFSTAIEVVASIISHIHHRKSMFRILLIYSFGSFIKGLHNSHVDVCYHYRYDDSEARSFNTDDLDGYSIITHFLLSINK